MFQISRQVSPSMTDSRGRLKLFSAIQLMQDCSEMWKESEVGFRDYLRETGGAQLLAFRQLEIRRVPALYEELTCTTTVFDCRGAQGFRNTIITDAAGNPCYESWSQGAFVNRKTGRLMRLPQRVIDSLNMSPRYDMPYRSRKIELPSIAGIILPVVAVQRNDIDYNQHVNNAHYIRMALEFLPAGFDFASLRVEYKQPACWGARLQPLLYDAGTALYIVLKEGAQVCCIVEFNKNLQSDGSDWFAW